MTREQTTVLRNLRQVSPRPSFFLLRYHWHPKRSRPARTELSQTHESNHPLWPSTDTGLRDPLPSESRLTKKLEHKTTESRRKLEGTGADAGEEKGDRAGLPAILNLFSWRAAVTTRGADGWHAIAAVIMKEMISIGILFTPQVLRIETSFNR